LQKQKLLSLFGLAKKAGRITLGYDKAVESAHKNKAYVIFTASDLSEKTEKGLIYATESKNIKVIRTEIDIFEISQAVGQKTGIVSVNDAGFGKTCLKLIEEPQKQEGNGI